MLRRGMADRRREALAVGGEGESLAVAIAEYDVVAALLGGRLRRLKEGIDVVPDGRNLMPAAAGS